MDPATWQLPYGLIILSLFCIVMCRANGTYWIGRAIVAGAGRSRWRRILESRAYETGSSWLNRWGAPAVTLSFLVVGVQTMVSLVAGVTRMPLRRYLPAVTIGCVIWAFIYGTGGMVSFVIIARAWEHNPLLTVLGLAVIVGAFASFFLRRGRRTVESPDQPSNRREAPLSAD
jgi:possible integral membrane protein